MSTAPTAAAHRPTVRREAKTILRSLTLETGQIESAAVMTTDGLVIAEQLSPNTDADRFAAMCASMLALAQRAAQEIDRGNLRQVMIEGDRGSMLLVGVGAGTDAVLAVATQPDTPIGRVFIDARRAAERIRLSILGVATGMSS